MNLKTLIYLLLVLTFNTTSNADDSAVRFSTVVGEPYQLDFGDGRLAVIKAVKEHKLYKINATVLESQCFPKANKPLCSYPRQEFDLYTLSVVWNKHPDAKKIGQNISITNSTGSSRAPITLLTIGPEASYRSQDPIVAKSKIQFTCPDFTWLHGSSEIPSQIEIPVMATTSMSINHETQESQNQISDGVREVLMTAVDSKTLEVQQMQHSSGFRLSESTTMFFGGLDSMWVLEGPEGEACQIRLGLLIADTQSSTSESFPKFGGSKIMDSVIQREIIKAYYIKIKSLTEVVVK